MTYRNGVPGWNVARAQLTLEEMVLISKLLRGEPNHGSLRWNHYASDLRLDPCVSRLDIQYGRDREAVQGKPRTGPRTSCELRNMIKRGAPGHTPKRENGRGKPWSAFHHLSIIHPRLTIRRD